MNIKRSILGMLAILFVFTGLAYAKETVKIGLITPLTGDVKTYGNRRRIPSISPSKSMERAESTRSSPWSRMTGTTRPKGQTGL